MFGRFDIVISTFDFFLFALVRIIYIIGNCLLVAGLAGFCWIRGLFVVDYVKRGQLVGCGVPCVARGCVWGDGGAVAAEGLTGVSVERLCGCGNGCIAGGAAFSELVYCLAADVERFRGGGGGAVFGVHGIEKFCLHGGVRFGLLCVYDVPRCNCCQPLLDGWRAVRQDARAGVEYFLSRSALSRLVAAFLRRQFPFQYKYLLLAFALAVVSCVVLA